MTVLSMPASASQHIFQVVCMTVVGCAVTQGFCFTYTEPLRAKGGTCAGAGWQNLFKGWLAEHLSARKLTTCKFSRVALILHAHTAQCFIPRY